MSVRTTTKDYRGDDTNLTNKLCADCGERLNETEVDESKYYSSGRMLCTEHLHKELGIPE